MGIQPTTSSVTVTRLQQPSPRARKKRCGSGESNPGFNHGKVVGCHCLTTAGFPRAESNSRQPRYQRGALPLGDSGMTSFAGVIGQIRTGPYEGHDLAC